jgi:hypothetical protein
MSAFSCQKILLLLLGLHCQCFFEASPPTKHKDTKKRKNYKNKSIRKNSPTITLNCSCSILEPIGHTLSHRIGTAKKKYGALDGSEVLRFANIMTNLVAGDSCKCSLSTFSRVNKYIIEFMNGGPKQFGLETGQTDLSPLDRQKNPPTV